MAHAQVIASATQALATLKNSIQNPPTFNSILARADWYQKNIVGNQLLAAQEIMNLYVSGALDAHDFDQALADLPLRQDFLQTLQNTFYQLSIEHLSRSQTPQLLEFMKMYHQKEAGGALPIFRLTGHYSSETQGVSDQGGFHRATGSIYANFETITPSEWYIIFSHELLHSLDQNLWTAMQAYGSNPHVPEFAEWAKTKQSFSELSPDQRKLLEEWVRSGLDRGLWAEYRAWVATFVLYRAGLTDGTWSHVAWMDSLLKPGQTTEELKLSIYEYLDSRSTDPDAEIFKLPLIKSAITTVRLKYRGTGQLPPMGNLEQILLAN